MNEKPGLAMVERFHAMDALRAAMMFAVVLLHSAMFFSDSLQLRAIFRFADPDRGPGFETLVKLLNAVSMPTFFLVSGFFTGLLLDRRGVRGMLRNRFRRITLPFLVSWPILYVGCVTGLFLGCLSSSEVVVAKPDDLGVTVRHIGERIAEGESLMQAADVHGPRTSDNVLSPDDPTGKPAVWLVRGPAMPSDTALQTTVKMIPLAVVSFFLPEGNRLVHVWFLWVLTIFAILTALLAPFSARLPLPRIPVLVLVLVAVFYLSEYPYIPPAMTLAVPLTTLAAYGSIFLMGMVLRHRRELFDTASRWWPWMLGGGTAAFLIGDRLFVSMQHEDTVPLRLGMAIGAALGHTLLTWGMLGLFHRYFRMPRVWVRTLSAASYWIYLVHLPLLLWVAAALLHWDVSRFVKFPLYLMIGFGVPLLTYVLASGGRESTVHHHSKQGTDVPRSQSRSQSRS